MKSPDESAPQPPTIMDSPTGEPAAGSSEPPPMGADNYSIGAEIARGGMGAILQAEDRKLRRTVALKVMLLDADADAATRERFIREAEVLAQLAHPNIVPIYDIVWENGLPLFYTMKLIRGRTLQAILNDLRNGKPDPRGEYTLDRLLLVFRKVCDALAFAHSKGIIHRDLKPDNVMVGEFGEVLVMDWGLAKRLNDEWGTPGDGSGSAAGLDAGQAFQGTMTGSVMGTPQYMSPEQARGEIEALDERSDIFSLGGILYAILTLRPPVEGATLEEVLEKVRTGSITVPTTSRTAPALGRPASRRAREVLEAKLLKPLPHIPGGRVPAALSSVAMKALRLDKAQRYQAVGELSADIEKYQGGFATTAENAGAWKQLALLIKRHKAVVTASGVALLALTGFGVWFVVNLRASERVARANEQLARQNEKRARTQEEQTRRALGKSQISVAEAAFRSGNRDGMVQALDSVPDDLRDQVWRYLSAKRDASLGPLALPGVTDVVDVVAVPGQPDCFGLALAAGEVQVVNVRAGRKLWGVKTPFFRPVRFGFTRDGSVLATTGNGPREIHIMSAADGSILRKIPSPAPGINRLLFSPDAGLLACGAAPGSDARLTVVDAGDGSVRWQAKQGQSGMDFSPDGARLFVSSLGAQRWFRTFETATGKLLNSVAENVYSQAMSLDGKLIAAALQNGEVIIYEVATGKAVRRAKLHDGEIHSVAWTAGGHLLTAGSEGGFERLAKGRRLLRLWNADNFASRGIFFGLGLGTRLSGPRSGWEFQPRGGWLITKEAAPQRWHLAVDAEAARITSVAEQGWSVAFPTDTLLLSRRAFNLGLFDVSDPRRPRALPALSPQGYVVGAVHWGARLVAIGRGIDRASRFTIMIHATDPAMTLKREITLPERVTGLDFDPPAGRLLAAMRERNAIIVDLNSGKQLLTLPATLERAFFAGAANHVVGIVSEREADGAAQDSVVILDSKTGRRLRSEPQPQLINALHVSPDRRLIAIAGQEQVVRVLDAETLAERHRFRAHDDDIRAIAFHPNRPILASASNDGTLKLWDYETANLRQTFHGLDGPPVALAFSPNGRLLALEAQERHTRVFDLSASGPVR